MNVTKISSINFMSKIIDSHAHIGKLGDKIYSKQDLDVFVKSELPNNDIVEKMIVSDLDVLTGVKHEYEGNKQILEVFKNNNKYSLIASCNPQNGNIDNIKKLFSEEPQVFVGLKFHPDIQNLDLSSEKYVPYMKFASEKNLPCLFHTQVDLLDGGRINPNIKHISDPENIYSVAKKHPNIPIVMAHMGAGWNEAHDKAIDVLIESIRKGDANLYADVSWVDIDNTHTHIVKAIKRLKGIGEKDWKFGDQSYRLMFGTDAPLARFQNKDAKEIYASYIEAIKSSIRNDKDLKFEAEKIIDDLFYNNANKLYQVSKKKEKSINKKFFTCLAIVFGICISAFIVYKNLIRKNISQK